MWVTQIFLLFFRNSFFFVYRHSDLEGLCSNGTKTRHVNLVACLWAVAGHEIWHWAAQFETFMERNCWAYDACAAEVWTEGAFTLTLFQGWGMGSEEVLQQVQLNFSFRNKFIILPCGLLIDNNIFKNVYSKVLLAALFIEVKSWRGIPPTHINGLMTILSPAGQFSSMDNPLPSVFIHDQKQVWYPFWSSAQKLQIILMHLRKTFGSGGRKLKETWLNLKTNPLVKVF
jgi:hypothetical protein